MVAGKHAVALREEVFQRANANLRQSPRRAEPSIPGVKDHRVANKPSPAVKRKFPFSPLVKAHLSPVTGHAKDEARCSGCQQIPDIDGEAEDTRRVGLLVMNVSA